MPTVFLNGRFIDDAEPAVVSVLDAGFQHGVGLFETMLGGVSASGEPWVLHGDRHMERLAGSARELGLSADLRTAALSEAVVETIRRAGLPRARVRLTVTAGDLSLLSRTGSSAAGDPTVLIVAQPATSYPEAMFERGGAVVIADARANPLNPFEGHKTLNYWWRLRELQSAAARGAAESLVLQVSNHVGSGCVSNLFAVREGELVTPIARGEEQEVGGKGALPSPVLPGITRGWVIDEAERRGMRVRRRMIAAAEVLDADEVFLTNSSWGVLPIVKVEAGAIGDGVPGKHAREFRRAWLSQFE
ncbi:MAG: aminotransferase class IV family protein [Phycisphaerales bacterium]|nr:aminotransferase class IV family protein [Phycisphaerales bacterium]